MHDIFDFAVQDTAEIVDRCGVERFVFAKLIDC